jgi:hypothetical protein
MHDGVQAVERAGVDRAARRIPHDAVAGSARAQQRKHTVAVGFQRRSQRTTDES